MIMRIENQINNLINMEQELYYEINIINSPLGYNTTICESLKQVYNFLDMIDHLWPSDDGMEIKIKGVLMLQDTYHEWCLEFLDPLEANRIIERDRQYNTHFLPKEPKLGVK